MDHQAYLAERKSSKTSREIFEKAKTLENVDRESFQTSRTGWEIVDREDLSKHPHKSLIPLFKPNGDADKVAFAIESPSIDDADPNKRVFTLDRGDREKMTGEVSITSSLTDFKTTFLDVFCEGQLRYLNWNNVFAAGGGILACAQPIPPEHAETLTLKRQYFHELQYSSSDVDLFLYGMNEEEARAKLLEIYQSVCEACPQTVVCFRSAHAVTLVSQYPFRHIQIVLRLYSSPYEVLAGFDVDACTIGFDGKQVYADVRCHNALVTRRNTIDVTRRSPSYEMRLAKYGVRGFEVEVADLKRDMIDPGIYERPWNSLTGLGKLLVLERLRTPEQRHRFFEMQKLTRGGGDIHIPRGGPEYSNSMQERLEEKLGGTAEVSNYSTVFLPWGPEYNAESTMRLMSKKDSKLNSPWFAKDRAYRLHPCFFGTAEEILEDCSPDDPTFPEKKEDENPTMKEHRDTYVRGRLTFLSDDPGRQRIGSFHPLSEVGWAEGVYFHESTEDLFSAVNADDAARTKSAIEFVKQGPDVRDFFGRTALHLSLISGSMSAMKVLLEAGASPMEPMAGGRTVFHLAALYDRTEAVPLLKEALRNYLLTKLQNESGGEKDRKEEDDAVMVGKEVGKEEDDEKMDVVEGVSAKDMKKLKQTIRNTIRATDGDQKMMAFQMALILGNMKTAKELLKAGSSIAASEVVGVQNFSLNPVLLLSDANLEEGVKMLIENGYQYLTETSNIVAELCQRGDLLGLQVIFKLDKEKAIKAMNSLTAQMVFPIQSCVEQGNLECVEFLLKTKKCVLEANAEIVGEALKLNPNNWQLKNWSPENNRTVPVQLYAFQGLLSQLFAYRNLLSTRHWLTPSESRSPQKKRWTVMDQVNSSMNLPEKQIEKIQEEIEKRMKICQLILKEIDVGNMYYALASDYRFNSLGYRFSDEYWITHKKHTQHQPLAISIAEYVAFFFGHLDYDLNQSEAKFAYGEVKPSTFRGACQELEAHLKGIPHLQETLKGWRISEEINDRNAGVDPLLGLPDKEKKRLEKFIAENRKTLISKMDELSKLLKCPTKVREFSKDNTNKSHNANKGSFGVFNRRVTGTLSVYAIERFPKATDFFFTKNDMEKDVRQFLLTSENQNPPPATIDADFNKNCDDSWAIAAIQRNLFKFAARSYSPFGILRDGYGQEEFNLTRMNNHNSLGAKYRGEIQETLCLTFAMCRKGQYEGLQDFCGKKAPLLSVDREGKTPLIMGILSGSIETCKEIMKIVKLQQFKPKKAQKGAAPKRIDNFELMAEMDEEGSGEEEPEEEEEEAPEEEDDDDDDDEDGARKPKKPKVAEVEQEWQSSSPISTLFCVPASLFLENHEIVKKVLESKEKLEAKRGKSGLPQFPTMFQVTPLQLAIILRNVEMVQFILDEALSFGISLVKSVVNHPFCNRSGFGSFDLAIALDAPLVLQALLGKSPYSLDWNWFATTIVGLDTFSFNAGLQKEKRKVKGGFYQGLQSSLFGEKKRKNAEKRDPRLGRITRLPLPQNLFLHIAARWGSVQCYKLLLDAPKNYIHESIVSFLKSNEGKPVHDLFTKAKERTPLAFAKISLTPESEANFIIRYFIGGDDTIVDNYNRNVLHHAIFGGKLKELLSGGITFSKQLMSKSYTKVPLEESIMFQPDKRTTLGDFTAGGSPLSLACYLNDPQSVEICLNDFKFDPNLVDAYFWGMNAFHLSLFYSHWTIAKIVAKKMEANKLLQSNSYGITPLMTAAKSGTIDGLLAALEACPSAKKSLVSDIVLQKDQDGFTSLHFATNAKFAETLKKLMDWSVASEKKDAWFCEEFTSGRTPLDNALAVVISSDYDMSNARKQARLSSTTEADNEIQEEEEEEDSEMELEEEDTERIKDKDQEDEKLREKKINGKEVLELLKKASSGRKRTRALFKEVRPARERRLATIGETTSSGDVQRSIEDYQTVWKVSTGVVNETMFANQVKTDSGTFLQNAESIRNQVL